MAMGLMIKVKNHRSSPKTHHLRCRLVEAACRHRTAWYRPSVVATTDIFSQSPTLAVLGCGFHYGQWITTSLTSRPLLVAWVSTSYNHEVQTSKTRCVAMASSSHLKSASTILRCFGRPTWSATRPPKITM